MARDIVGIEAVFWALVPAGGTTFDIQNGPGALTVSAQVAGVCTITMPANNQIPILRREVRLWSRGTAAQIATYNEAASAVGTVVTANTAGAQVATNVPFGITIARVMALIGGGVG